MRKRTFAGAYSQRYSNAAATTFAGATAQPGTSTQRRFIVKAVADNPQYGSASVSVATRYSNAAATPSLTDKVQDVTWNGYLEGTVLRLKATANSNGKFVGWADGVAAAERTVTVTGAATYTARFISKVQRQNLRLTCVAKRGRIAGTGLVEESAADYHATTRVYTFDCDTGDTITFTAIPLDGFHFKSWRIITGTAMIGNKNLNSPELTLKMNGSASLEAVFEPNDPTPEPHNDPEDPPYNPEGPTNEPGNNPTPPYQPENPVGVPSGNVAVSGIDLMALARKYWWVIAIVAGYYIFKEGKK